MTKTTVTLFIDDTIKRNAQAILGSRKLSGYVEDCLRELILDSKTKVELNEGPDKPSDAHNLQ